MKNEPGIPKLEEVDENEKLEEKTQAPWKWLIFCGVILLLIIACIIVIVSI